MSAIGSICRGLRVQSMNSESDRRLTALLAVYAIAVLLLVCVSARLWWQSPLNLITYEFDYFLGLFAHTIPGAVPTDLAGMGRQNPAGIGLCDCRLPSIWPLVRKLVLAPAGDGATRSIAVMWATTVVAAGFAFGMPARVSPDVFFYIGTGWVESYPASARISPP